MQFIETLETTQARAVLQHGMVAEGLPERLDAMHPAARTCVLLAAIGSPKRGNESHRIEPDEEAWVRQSEKENPWKHPAHLRGYRGYGL